MATPAIPVDVINLAMLKLNQKPIASLTDTNNPAAITANITYDATRRSLLREHIWNFAKVRAMAPLVNAPNSNSPLAPPFDYLNYYQLPPDLVRLLFVGYDFTRFSRIPYDINGTKLLLNPTDFCNTATGTPWPSVAILYQTDFQNVSQMDALFVNVLATQLASEMCMAITGNAKLNILLEEKLKQVLAEAQAVNHQEKPVIVTDIDRISIARQVTSSCHELNINPVSWGDVDDS